MTKSLLFTLFGVFFLCSAQAQLGGGPQATNCTNAINVLTLPYNSPIVPKYTTCGNGNTYNSANACANTYSNSEDFLYKFTPTAANTCISITLSALRNNYPGLFVFDGCPSDTLSYCVAQKINLDLSSAPLKTCSIVNLQLVAGRTYYIMASAQSGCYDFDMSITSSTCVPPPTGSDCKTAVAIPSLPYTSNNQSTCGRGAYYNRGNTKCFGYDFLNGEATTYSYKPTKDECAKITLKTDSLYSGLFLYQGCPTNPKSTCVSYRTYAFSDLVINAVLKAGVEYFIVVDANSTYSKCITYDLNIAAVDDSGSVCANAYKFPTNNHVFKNHTTQCKGDNYDTHNGCNTGFNYMNGEETVYTFSGSTGECIGLSLIGYEAYKYGGLYLMDKCPGDPAAKCLGFASKYFYPGDNVVGMEFNVDTPGTYYVVVGVPYLGDYYNITYDLVLSTSFLDSTGIDCRRSHNIGIPFSQNNMNVSCKGNDYDQLDACRSKYMAGNDYVFKFTAPRSECLKFTTFEMDGKGGVFLLDSCPDRPGASCLESAVCDFAPCDSVSFIYTVTAGKTYYLIVAAYQGAKNLNFDIRIDTIQNTNACTYCATDICIACQNVGFERMDFAGWQGYTGLYANPKSATGISDGPVNNGDSRHTIMSAGSYDPVVGPELSTVSPSGEKYSVRLGNRLTGAQGEMLTYTFVVDSTTRNFFYYYAVVFQDPGSSHSAAEKPYFKVSMFDNLGAEINCAHYEVIAGPGIPGFKSAVNDPQAIWKDWTLVTVPLDSYIGKSVTIEFTTLDCSQSGHFGYAYIDAFCGNIAVKASKPFLCTGDTVELTAPNGFKTYQWSTGATTQSVTVNAAGTYSVVLTPFSSNPSPVNACAVTLDYVVKSAPNPTAAFEVEIGCMDSILTFKDVSTFVAPHPIAKWDWSFGDNTTSNTQHPIHGFPGPGTYNVTLTIANAAGCPATITKPVTIDPYPFLPPLNTPDSLFVCERGTIQFTADNIPNVVYKWTGPAGFTSSLREPVIDPMKLQDSGMFHLQVTLTTDTCVKAYDSTYVTVKAFPKFKIKPDTSICFLSQTVDLYAEGGEKYNWSPGNLFNDSTLARPIAQISATSSYTVKILNDLCPDSTMSVKVTVLKPVDPVQAGADFEICLLDSFTLNATANPDQYFSWSGPNGFSSNQNEPAVNGALPTNDGYYVVQAYLGPNKFCPFGKDSTYVKVNPQPNLAITPTTPSLCPGDSVLLSVSGANVYSWFYSDYVEFAQTSSIILTPDSTATVMSSGMDVKGCKGLSNATVVVKEQFKPDLGPDKSLCLGQTQVINLNTADFYKVPSSVKWSTGQTGNSITVSQTGNYKVEVTIDNCTKFDSINVVFQNPALFTLGNDSLLCQGQTHTLDLSSYGQNVTWTDGNTQNVRVISSPGGNYDVTIVNGSCVLQDDINLNFQPQHTVNLGIDTTFCSGGNLVLSTSFPTDAHQWTDGIITSSNPTFQVSADGVHTVQVMVTKGVCSANDTKIVTIETPPLPALGPDQTVCENQVVTLDPKISLPATFRWSDNTFNPTLAATQPGSYDVIVTKGTCTVYDTITINHDLIPLVNIGPDSTICEDKSVALDATVSGNASYSWNTGANTAQISVNQLGSYEVTVTRGQCQNKDLMILNVDLIPVFDLGADQTLCVGDTLILNTGLPGLSYNWNTSETTQSIEATKSGTYSVTTTQGKCSFPDNVTLTFQVPPILDLGADVTRCQGTPATFSTTVLADSYTWNTGSTTNGITVTNAGLYKVDIVVGVCELSDSALLIIDIPPVIFLGNDTTACGSINLTLDATVPNGYYVWSNGTSQGTLTITNAGTYSAQVTQGACVVSDSIDVFIQTPHTVSLPQDQVLCVGQQFQITSQTNAVNPIYNWSTGQLTPDINVNTSNVYWLEVSTGVCSLTDSIDVQFLAPPTVAFGPDRLLCDGDSVILDATYPGSAYTWSTGETTPKIIIKTNGLYGVRAYIGPCEDKDEILLTFQTPPFLDLGPDQEICKGEHYDLLASVPNATYLWSNGQTTPTIKAYSTGVYSVKVTQGPCVVNDQMQLTVHPLPTVELNDTAICLVDSAFINAFCFGCTYLWQDNFTGSSRWVMPKTVSKVKITNQFGCVIRPDVAVNMDPNCWDEIFVPNTFTPNEDGYNEVFKVRYGNVTVTSIIIADRWGEVIYQSSNPDQGWDGLYLGAPAKEDVYGWKVIYKNQYNQKKEIFGHVTLLR